MTERAAIQFTERTTGQVLAEITESVGEMHRWRAAHIPHLAQQEEVRQEILWEEYRCAYIGRTGPPVVEKWGRMFPRRVLNGENPDA